jgi:hypothetical protein
VLKFNVHQLLALKKLTPNRQRCREIKWIGVHDLLGSINTNPFYHNLCRSTDNGVIVSKLSINTKKT